ncbi:DNA ligase 4 [Paragonimus westermani]|uniref:DNA ligase IV n=1 Tax=Paragonimus westermani TaxID=34504 RepID=A0A5J4P2R7_9TREM|nr:DNA ligase 4 [Paragonimus westermani]
MSPTTQLARSATGGRLPIIGEVQCTAVLNGLSIKGTCYVTRNPGLNLLGLDWIDELHLFDRPLLQICKRTQAQQKPTMSPEVNSQLTNALQQRHSDVFAEELGCCIQMKAVLFLCPGVKSYSLPIPEDLFTKLNGGECFAKLDLAEAYLQLPVAEGSKELLTINTHKGLYRFNQLPFGVKTASAIFQQVMDMMLTDIPGAAAYLDNVIVMGHNAEDREQKLDQTLTRLGYYVFRLRGEKCSFGMPSIKYIGFIVDKDGRRPDPASVEAVQRIPPPTNVLTTVFPGAAQRKESQFAQPIACKDGQQCFMSTTSRCNTVPQMALAKLTLYSDLSDHRHRTTRTIIAAINIEPDVRLILGEAVRALPVMTEMIKEATKLDPILWKFDRARPAYGLREASLTRLYIKAFGIAPKGPTAQRLTHPSSQGAKLAKGTDFADILFDTVRGCCREDSVLLLKDANDLLDRLACAKSMDERLVAVNTLIPLATANEHRWIVRLIVRRDSGCGLSGTAVLQCIHPAAVRLWDALTNFAVQQAADNICVYVLIDYISEIYGQDLMILCQNIADLDPNVTPSIDPITPRLTLFVPFRPMLCERANSVDQLCASALQLCTLGLEDVADARLLLETKYDGERVQLHKCGTQYRYWSRNCLEWTESYGADGIGDAGTLTPRLHQAFATHVRDCILDGEMMAYNTWTDTIMPKTTGFDVKRGQCTDDVKVSDNASEHYQPCLMVFDLVYLNGELLTSMPLLERKHLLAQLFGLDPTTNGVILDSKQNLSDLPVVCPPPLSLVDGTVYLSGWCQGPVTVSFVDTVFNQMIDYRQEGVVAKLTAGLSPYLPGHRIRSGWWKLKPDYVSGLLTDLDCLVVGGYYSSFSHSGTHHVPQSKRIRQFLCAVRGSDTQSIETSPCLPSFLSFCRIHAAELVPTNAYAAGLTPRFPRVVTIRNDKSWQDCLTMDELIRLNVDTQGKLVTKLSVPPVHVDSESGDESTQHEVPRVGIMEAPRLDDLHLSFSSPESLMESASTDEQLVTHLPKADGQTFGNLHTGFKRTPFPVNPKASSTPVKKLPCFDVSVICPSHSTSICSTSDSSISSCAKFLDQLELCLLLSKDVSPEEKHTLENQIRSAGGRLVQNPGCNTFCVIADKLTAKTRNLIASSGQLRSGQVPVYHDIACLTWFHECFVADKLLPWKPNDLLSMKPDTAAKLNAEYDCFGDSFTEEMEVDELKQFLLKLDPATKSTGSDSGIDNASTHMLVKELVSEFGSAFPLGECTILPVRFRFAHEDSLNSQRFSDRVLLADLRKNGADILDVAECTMETLDDTFPQFISSRLKTQSNSYTIFPSHVLINMLVVRLGACQKGSKNIIQLGSEPVAVNQLPAPLLRI